MNAKIEALKAKQAAEMNELIAEVKFTESLPAEPRYLNLGARRSLGYPNITYQVDGLFAAIQLAAKFPVLVNMIAARDGSMRIMPEEVAEKFPAYKRCDDHEFGVSVSVQGLLNSPGGANVKLGFFTRINGEIVGVDIDVKGRGYIGAYNELAAEAVNLTHTRAGTVADSFRHNPKFCNAQKSIAWATGERGKGYNHEYLYSADYYGERRLYEQDNMLAALVHLARSAGEKIPDEWEYQQTLSEE